MRAETYKLRITTQWNVLVYFDSAEELDKATDEEVVRLANQLGTANNERATYGEYVFERHHSTDEHWAGVTMFTNERG